MVPPKLLEVIRRTNPANWMAVCFETDASRGAIEHDIFGETVAKICSTGNHVGDG
jgi:hypothetical protein